MQKDLYMRDVDVDMDVGVDLGVSIHEKRPVYVHKRDLYMCTETSKRDPQRHTTRSHVSNTRDNFNFQIVSIRRWC